MIERSGLEALETALSHALETCDAQNLKVLGYGEISSVLGYPKDAPEFACKRLPTFTRRTQFEAYAAVFHEYLATLRDRGVDVAPTDLIALDVDGGVAAWCVQPVYDASWLLPRVFSEATPDPDHPLLQKLIVAVQGVVTPTVGLDAQLSNWVFEPGGALRYLDVTTPMLRDGKCRSRVDARIFLKAYPWFLRGPLRVFVVPSIMERYHQLHTVLLDIVSNLIKEQLEAWIPACLEAFNRILEDRLTEAEVRKDYRSDARMWALMLRLRRLDRGWQRRVRRRTYPFLLPTHIQR